MGSHRLRAPARSGRAELVSDEGLRMARIIVTKTLTDDDVILTIDSEPDDLPVIDGAGMLSMALDTWYRIER